MSDDDELRYRFVPTVHDMELYEAEARRIAGGDGWFALRSPRGILFRFEDVEHAQAFRVWAERSQHFNGSAKETVGLAATADALVHGMD